LCKKHAKQKKGGGRVEREFIREFSKFPSTIKSRSRAQKER